MRSLSNKLYFRLWKILLNGLLRQKGGSGWVRIDRDKQTVRKRVILYREYGVIENEVYWLQRLAGLDFVPRLIERKGNVLVIEYAGENLTAQNIPTDWESQMTDMLDGLRAHGCSHNDIKSSDILVRNRRLMLIDFQWATPIGQPPPSHWPVFLGDNFKAGDHAFDDETSLRKAFVSVLEKTPTDIS